VVTFTALYDACVLYPAPLRDLLMRLAMTDLFRARWSADIHREWMASVLRDRPDLTLDQLERTRDLMDGHVRDCLVTGYEDLIPAIRLPDSDDRHVLAAAIRSRAHVIVTFNLKDFPEDCLSPYGTEAQHPDDFVAHLLDLWPGDVCAAVKRQRGGLKRPPRSVRQLLDSLEKSQLPMTVSRLREFADLL
jgi:predicted nucleic acid-binding protein